MPLFHNYIFSPFFVTDRQTDRHRNSARGALKKIDQLPCFVHYLISVSTTIFCRLLSNEKKTQQIFEMKKSSSPTTRIAVRSSGLAKQVQQQYISIKKTVHKYAEILNNKCPLCPISGTFVRSAVIIWASL